MLTTLQDAGDDYIPLNDAGKHIPGRPHRATIWRWAFRGIKRGGRTVKLRTTSIGARRYTTPKDIERFLADCNSEPVSDAVSHSFLLRAEAAGQILEAMGVRPSQPKK